MMVTLIVALIFLLIIFSSIMFLIKGKIETPSNPNITLAEQELFMANSVQPLIPPNPIIHYNNAIKHLHLAQNDPNVKYLALYKLANLYHNGISDNYLVKGVPPNPQKAIATYQQLITEQSPFQTISVLNLADIYHWGLGEYTGNRQKARELYQHLEKYGKYHDKIWAKDRLIQMYEEDNNGISIYNNTKPFYADQLGFYFPTLSNTPAPHIYSILSGENITPPKKPSTTDTKYNITITPPIKEKNIESPIIRNDLNNVHDHVVNNSIKNSINKLQKTTNLTIDLATTLVQIRKYINDYKTNMSNKLNAEHLNQKESEKQNKLLQHKIESAIMALDNIEKNNHLLGATNTKEVDLLHLVWNRIHSRINHENKETLKENLINELSESVEHNAVVCTSGRFNRIIDTLNFIDPDVTIKPTWAIQSEMMNSAVKIREEMMSNLSTADRNIISNYSESESDIKKYNSFMDEFKSRLITDFHKTYVESGLMSKDLLESEINKWINNI